MDVSYSDNDVCEREQVALRREVLFVFLNEEELSKLPPSLGTHMRCVSRAYCSTLEKHAPPATCLHVRG